jgi:zinc protease
MSAITHYPVSRDELENGLTLLVKEQHASPVSAVVAHVNIGYFNEADRWNGLSHVIEHMLFKGTLKRPGKEQIAEEVRSLGAMINAGTYYDQTSYYIVGPAENTNTYIEILADMVSNPLFDSEELAKELEVIIQESKQKRDSPTYVLLQEMYARAFDKHRLRRWRIGQDDTLRRFRKADLVAFVEETYRPENIVLSIVGAVEAAKVADSARVSWSGLPRRKVFRDESPVEPPRSGLRYDRITGAISQRLVEIGCHAPDLLHPDSAPLSVLGALLSDGRSSRLYRTLKEDRKVANSVWAGYEGFEDVGVFTLGGESVSDDPLALEQGLFEQALALADGPISTDELQRVKTRIESRRLFSEEEVLGVARTLAFYEAAVGDYRIADETLARLKAVTADEVRRVASDYVRADRATILEYLPDSVSPPRRDASELRRLLLPAPQPAERETAPRSRSEATAPEVGQVTLPCGASLLVRRRSDLPIVALHALFPGGRRGETRETCGITNLMLKASLKGAPGLTAEEIANRIEGLGTGIGLNNAPDYFGFSLKVLRSRLSDALEILRKVICEPLFDEAEVERERQSIFGEIRRHQDSMSGRAADLCNEALYGDSPYGLPSSGVVEAVRTITADALRKWHRDWVRGPGCVIGVVGDIGLDEAAELMAPLAPCGAPVPAPALPVVMHSPGEISVQIERQQTAAVMAFPGVSTYHDDLYALDMVAEITSGQAGRFFQAVRGDNALAYAVSSFHRARVDSGAFMTYTATSPANEATAREILLAECSRLANETVGEQELADAKEAIIGDHVISQQTFGAQAGRLAIDRLIGKPIDAPEKYLDRIRALTSDDVQRVAALYLDPGRTWRGVVRGSVTDLNAAEGA